MDANEPGSKRFASVSLQDIATLVENKDSQSTKKRVLSSSTLLKEYLSESGQNTDVKSSSVEELDNQLCQFYASVRTKKGDYFKTNSFYGLKYGVSKFIKSETGLDIVEHEGFNSSREVFKAVLVDMKKTGFGTTEHTPQISPEDMKRLYDPGHLVFSVTVPVGLQRKVWFELMFYLCRRGRENLRSMTRNTFGIETDASGRRYVFQKQGEMDKNHRETDRPDDTVGEGRMYELKGNDLCPVSSYEKYISKLHPDNDALWQRALDAFEEEKPWYTKSPLGKNTVGTMMNAISKQACLSRMYTNHCIRATAITALDDAGVEARHIMRTTGHKNESSIRSYSQRVCDEKKRDMSDMLSAARNAPATVVRGKRQLQPSGSTNIIDNVELSVQPKKPCTSTSASHYVHDEENLDNDIDDLLTLTDSQMAGMVEQVRRSPIPPFSPQLQNTMNISQSTSDQRLLNYCPNIWNCNVTMNVYHGCMPAKK